MLRLNHLALVALLAPLAASSAPSANARPYVKKGSYELGLQMGGLFFLDAEAVPFDPAGSGFPTNLEHTFTYTATGTYNFTPRLGLELALQLSPAEVNRLSVFSAHLDAIWHPLTHDWFVPFLGAGPSFSATIPQGDYATDPDPGLNALAGVKLFPWERVGFRADLRYVLNIPTASDAADGRSEVTGHDLILSFGLMGTFGGEAKKKAPVVLDTDGDGIIDQSDACPVVPGQPSAQGCPDKDLDTLADSDDRCPENAGPVATKGCPDQDGDSLVDIDDRCPPEAGPVELKGCPDGDADQIANLDDKCPTIPGLAEHGGCPPPPPIEVVKKFSGVMKGITFEKNKDIIRKTSFTTLDEAVQVMKDYPQLRLMIEGHTSSEGSRDLNLDLSDRRAKSVKQYMVDKGVAADRIDTKGFGPDAPIADNKTEANRAKNRRIEFKILQPE
jgi:outer membrane protein OmpA-like peptidoglycan-associated protein